MAKFLYRLLKLPSGRILKTVNHHQLRLTINTGTVTSEHYDEEFVNIRGVIFDMDGTLTMASYDGRELLQRLPLPSDTDDILNAVWRLEEPEKTRLLRIIEQYEEEKREGLQLQPHLVKLLHFISSSDVKIALLTRNTSENVKYFQSHLQAQIDKEAVNLVASSVFSPVVTRDFVPTKPDPAPVLHICSQWGLAPKATMMVGDDWKDIMCGNKAGSVTVLLKNEKNSEHPSKAKPNFAVDSLDNLISLLQSTFTVESEE